ncbi:MAG: helix-turn-helix domain-containing protein [Lawsonibacter sp.]
MDRTKTGALIAAARKEQNMTQKELAAALHVSDRAVSKWERGAGFPDISLLEPLADALGLGVLDLLRGSGGQQRLRAMGRYGEQSALWSGKQTKNCTGSYGAQRFSWPYAWQSCYFGRDMNSLKPMAMDLTLWKTVRSFSKDMKTTAEDCLAGDLSDRGDGPRPIYGHHGCGGH